MEEMIINKLKEVVSGEKLDEILSKEINNFLQRTINDIFNSYNSDVYKEVKSILETKILNNIKNVDFVSYSTLVTDLIEKKLLDTMDKSNTAIVEMIDELTGSLEKNEWFLSEIIEKMTDRVGLEDWEELEISFHYELYNKYGWNDIAFDADSDLSKYQCKYRFTLNKDNKILLFTIDGNKIKSNNIPELDEFELFLYKLYMTDCTIICDVDDVRTNLRND